MVCSLDDDSQYLLEVYDTVTKISYFAKTFKKIHSITVDNSSIFLFVTPDHQARPGEERRDLIKLTEITVAEKIKILLSKRQMFDEAEMIAIESQSGPEIRAAISKEQADNLYDNRKYKEAMQHYIKTIGFEAPSYVIERYLDVSNLQFLIDYLEILIETPIQNSKHLFGNNKDYTALLLNCYIKEQRADKIEAQMEKDPCSETIFDVETAIEVCRQKEGY